MVRGFINESDTFLVFGILRLGRVGIKWVFSAFLGTVDAYWVGVRREEVEGVERLSGGEDPLVLEVRGDWAVDPVGPRRWCSVFGVA